MPRTDTKNLARYWRDKRTPGLTLLCADFTTHEYAPHPVLAVTEDGGTHLNATGDIPELQILKIDNKGRHNRRVRLGLVGP
ncbi:MAG: hypothetical protein ABI439_07540 [Rhodospirillales bacterium]